VLIGLLLLALAIIDSVQLRHHTDGKPETSAVTTPSSTAEQVGSP
jgi:hypothetical protein